MIIMVKVTDVLRKILNFIYGVNFTYQKCVKLFFILD